MLKHKFIKLAKKNSYLMELLDRQEQWLTHGNHTISDEDEESPLTKTQHPILLDEWDFGTLKGPVSKSTSQLSKSKPTSQLPMSKSSSDSTLHLPDSQEHVNTIVLDSF